MPQQKVSKYNYLLDKFVILILNCIFMAAIYISKPSLIGGAAIAGTNLLVLGFMLLLGKKARAVDFIPLMAVLDVVSFFCLIGIIPDGIGKSNIMPELDFMELSINTPVVYVSGAVALLFILIGIGAIGFYSLGLTAILVGMVLAGFSGGNSLETYRLLYNGDFLIEIICFLALFWWLALLCIGRKSSGEKKVGRFRLFLTSTFLAAVVGYLLVFWSGTVEKLLISDRAWMGRFSNEFLTLPRILVFSFALIFYSFTVSKKKYGYSGDTVFFSVVAMAAPIVKLLMVSVNNHSMVRELLNFSDIVAGSIFKKIDFVLIVAAILFVIFSLGLVNGLNGRLRNGEKGDLLRYLFIWTIASGMAFYFVFNCPYNLVTLLLAGIILSAMNGKKKAGLQAQSVVVEIFVILAAAVSAYTKNFEITDSIYIMASYLVLVIIANVGLKVRNKAGLQVPAPIPIVLMVVVAMTGMGMMLK